MVWVTAPRGRTRVCGGTDNTNDPNTSVHGLSPCPASSILGDLASTNFAGSHHVPCPVVGLRRRPELPVSRDIKGYAAAFREFLQEGAFPERKALIRNFVTGIETVEDEAVLA